jgi:hypothetical protein
VKANSATAATTIGNITIALLNGYQPPYRQSSAYLTPQIGFLGGVMLARTAYLSKLNVAMRS